MLSHHLIKKNAFLSGIILGIFVFLCPLQAESAENDERTLRFSIPAAIAALRFDRAEPDSLTGSTASGFSVKDTRLPGTILSGNSQMPELESVEAYGSFFGVKLTLQLKGGWYVYSGGDLEAGFGGMYDTAVDIITSSGVPIQRNMKKTSHSGFEVGGDLVYCITPRFGIGIGASRFGAKKESVLYYEVMSPDYDTLRAQPIINVTVLRLGLFYSHPFAGRLAISVHGGPALYNAEYEYGMGITRRAIGLPVVQMGLLPTGLNQDAKAKKLGVEGGVGFEFNPNPYVAFFIEALGRYARIEGFEGVEEANLYLPGGFRVVKKEGVVYSLPTDSYPLLEIVPPEGSAGEAGRKAVLDFSGFSFSAGLKLRF